MAAFSSFVDSIFLPNNLSTINNNIINNNVQIYQNLDQSTFVSAPSNNEASSVLSLTNKNTIDSSSIITHRSNDQITQKSTPLNRKRKCIVGSFANSAQSKDMREVKGKKKKEILKDGGEKNMSKEENKCEKQVILEEAPKGYIHVRARRGQATDSHSLAERARREKISERMKLLQSIVPGCDKVAGKALMLDIIINYVQSLQNQVEFLSLKLASLNDFGLDMEPFLIGPDQNLPSSFPTMHESSPTTANNFTLLDHSANSLLFHQSQIPSDMPQESRQVLWEMEDQRQKNINLSGFSNNLFLLH